MAFIDGENLTARFEDSLRMGREARRAGPNDPYIWSVTRVPGVFVWSALTLCHLAEREDLLRVLYYTTAAGAADTVDELAEEISRRRAFRVRGDDPFSRSAIDTWDSVQLVPRVFQKTARKTRTKSVDINLCVDVMEYVRHDALDAIFLLTGDVDYLPLVEAVMRAGKRVYVGALLNGLSPRLRNAADVFVPLNHIYFGPAESQT